MSRRSILPAAAALLTPLISWSIDLQKIEGSEESELDKLSQEEMETKKQLKIEDSLVSSNNISRETMPHNSRMPTIVLNGSSKLQLNHLSL